MGMTLNRAARRGFEIPPPPAAEKAASSSLSSSTSSESEQHPLDRDSQQRSPTTTAININIGNTNMSNTAAKATTTTKKMAAETETTETTTTGGGGRTTAATERTYADLTVSLLKDVASKKINASSSSSPCSSERAIDLLNALRKESRRTPVTVSILKKTGIGKALVKTLKACRRHQCERGNENDDDGNDGNDGNSNSRWGLAIRIADELLAEFKRAAGEGGGRAEVGVDKGKGKGPSSAGACAGNADSAGNAATTKKGQNGENCAAKPTSRRTRPSRRAKDDAVIKLLVSGRNHGNGSRAPPTKKQSKVYDELCIAVSPSKKSSSSPKEEEESPSPSIRSNNGKTGKTNGRSGCESSSKTNDGKCKEEVSTNNGNDAIICSPIENGEGAKKRGSAKSTEEDASSLSKGMTTTPMNCKNGSSDDNSGSKKNGNTEEEGLVQQQQRASSSPSENDRGQRQQQPSPMYHVCQRVYAKDDATGLLYPAFIRKVMWGPKASPHVNMGFCSSMVNGVPVIGMTNEEDAPEEDEEDDPDRLSDPQHNCHHYYVHYMGWNAKWDRWVEETFLYEDSLSTVALAKVLMKEYNKVKPKKKGQKMSVPQIRKWMKRMVELETEHKRSEEGSGGCDDAKDGERNDADAKSGKEEECASGDVEHNETMSEHFMKKTNATVDATMDEPTSVRRKGSSDTPKSNKNSSSNNSASKSSNSAGKSSNKQRKTKPMSENKQLLNEETLQKQAQLRSTGLQMKRKRSISDRLSLPFNLKKVLVDEWEVISQCGMVHNLPCRVSVREALDQYLENKLVPLREKHEKEKSANEGDDEMQVDESPGNGKKRNKQPVLGKEWIDMVEGIALFFDQALPVHLLFDDERGQYQSFRRQILAQRRNSAASAVVVSSVSQATKAVENIAQVADSDVQSATTAAAVSESSVASGNNLKSPPPNLLPERLSEIYGCEHLLRLFVRLPTVVAASPGLSELESRRIFSSLGDLVRYLQKHQSQLFCSSFRKPLPGECRGGGGSKKVGGSGK